MKLILPTCFFVFVLIGCQKQEEATSIQPDPKLSAAFEQSDAKIGIFLDQLDSDETSLEMKKQIICIGFPTEYKTHYIPALLKLANDYTEAKLLSDLDITLNHYKEKANIECDASTNEGTKAD